MNNMPEGVKEFKLTWVDPLQPDGLYSQMFDNQADVVYFLQDLDDKFDYMLFRFNHYSEQWGYTWDLQPFGSYKSYKYGMLISEFIVPVLIGLILIYFIIKK